MAPISKYGTSANIFASTTVYGVFSVFIFCCILYSWDLQIIKTIRNYVLVGFGPFRMFSELTLSGVGPCPDQSSPSLYWTILSRWRKKSSWTTTVASVPASTWTPTSTWWWGPPANCELFYNYPSSSVSVLPLYNPGYTMCISNVSICVIIITSDRQANLHCNI